MARRHALHEPLARAHLPADGHGPRAARARPRGRHPHLRPERRDALRGSAWNAAPDRPAHRRRSRSKTGRRGPRSARSARCWRPSTRAPGYEIADLEAAIAEEPPGPALDRSQSRPRAAGVAAASGIPWSIYLPYPWPGPARRRCRPSARASPPPTAALARARDGATEAAQEARLRSALSASTRRRAALGLPAFDRYEDLFLSPDVVIEFSAEPFEYPREWPPNVRLVGPCPLGARPPPSRSGSAGEERPIVLVTASTDFQDDAALDPLRAGGPRRSPYLVVATTAAHDPAEFDPPAERAGRELRAHGPILRRAAAAISHGGMGTTRRRSPPGSRSASSPSCAISSRSPAGSCTPAAARCCRPASAPRATAHRGRGGDRPAPGSRAGPRRVRRRGWRRCRRLRARRSAAGRGPGHHP